MPTARRLLLCSSKQRLVISRRALLSATVAAGGVGLTSGTWDPLANAAPRTVLAPAATGATRVNSKVGFSPSGAFPYLSDAAMSADLDLMVQAGASWLRLDFDRNSLHGGPNVYSWVHHDRVVAACASRGIKVLGLVFGSPAWDRPAGANDKFGPDTAERRAHFAQFCQAAAQRYDTTKVAAWEVWNEPNWPIFWTPRPDVTQYVALLRSAYAAFKSVRTTQPVLTGGTAPALDQPTSTSWPSYSPPAWLTRLYAMGARNYFDGISHHPYHYPYLRTDGDASWNAFQQVPLLRATMVANGDSSKKIWLTEFGCPTGTGSGAASEARQSQIIADGFSYAISSWPYLGAMFNYVLRDSGTNLADREQNFGIVRYDGTKKQVFAKFSQLSGLKAAG